MKKNNQDERLERFFQHNPIEDPLYLKRYVKEHPDHKMAWYLLGRQYAEKGEQGKAAYCFAQSGEIYEAFEKQKMVVDGPLPPFITAGDESETNAASPLVRNANRKWLAWIALFLILLLPASIDGAQERRQENADRRLPSVSDGIELATDKTQENQTDAGFQRPREGTRIYYADSDWKQVLPDMLASAGKGLQQALLLEGVKSADGMWTKWNQPSELLVGLEYTSDPASSARLHVYSSKVCSCEAGDGSALRPAIENWVQEREEAIVLQSAVEAFERKSGTLPERAEQLAQPYPNNLLPGLTPAMQSKFAEVLEELKNKRETAGSQSGEVQQSAGSNDPKAADSPKTPSPKQAFTYPFQEPLEIIVDTEKHRLALVSGNKIIRSYPVGLGGAKTPLGEFVITEKVRNPNGRSNGEFGSRGMTLSDTLYAIHGTNKPGSIGKDESHGCIRMLKDDVEELYDMIPQQTKVTIGKGLLPEQSPEESNPGSGSGVGGSKPSHPFKLPLQTDDSNSNKTYKWLD